MGALISVHVKSDVLFNQESTIIICRIYNLSKYIGFIIWFGKKKLTLFDNFKFLINTQRAPV